MNNENMPTLYSNIMYGLPSDFARDVFLWAVGRHINDRMCYSAEAFAREADLIAKSLTPMMDAAAKMHGMDAHDPELMGFILKRHANSKHGGNVQPDYVGTQRKENTWNTTQQPH